MGISLGGQRAYNGLDRVGRVGPDWTGLDRGGGFGRGRRVLPLMTNLLWRNAKRSLTCCRVGTRALPLAVVLLLLSLAAAVSQQAAAQSQQTVKVRGVVRDGSGKPVSGALVRLERTDGSTPMQAQTNADGEFAWDAVSVGHWAISAEKSGLRSKSREVELTSDSQPVRLMISIEPSLAQADGAANAGQNMEFSDAPSFTIAAVTDWTAAGGHGSDAILRTSESLTRDTIAMKAPASTGKDADLGNVAVTESEAGLRKMLAGAPGSFDANSRLGRFYLQQGRYREAIPLLEAAYRINAGDAANEYDLALALEGTGEFAEARERVRGMMAKHTTPDLLRLEGELDEKLGDPLAAVNALERAAHDDPSEENYFAWGSELLLHRAIWQAKDVFAAGVARYPKSPRLLTALGSALFACALYEEAAERLCEAANLSPESPEPYLFLGKIEVAAPNPLACVQAKLAEFAQREPGNPLASYYYAMAIWKQAGRSADAHTLAQVEGLLRKAVELDGKCSEAYLQLGVLHSTRHDDAESISYYLKAIDADPRLSEAYYRLGVAYDRVGEREKAKRAFQLHEEIEKQQKAAIEQQRREIKQFLVVQGKPAETTNP